MESKIAEIVIQNCWVMIHVISFFLLVGVKLTALRSTKYFRYDLNQIPYDYTVEVTNRFKGLGLIDRVPEELWMEVHDVV